MIPLLTAQRDSATVTSNSLSWFDKRYMRKIERKIDHSIQMAGDAMQDEVEIYMIYRENQKHFENQLTSKAKKRVNLLEILLTKYKIQGYSVKSNFKWSCEHNYSSWFYDYVSTLEIYITLKWDKDYNPILENNEMAKLENKYISELPKYKVVVSDAGQNKYVSGLPKPIKYMH